MCKFISFTFWITWNTPIESETSVTTTKVESQPAIVPTQSNAAETSQQASTVSFNANINDISFDSQLLPSAETPTTLPQAPKTYADAAKTKK